MKIIQLKGKYEYQNKPERCDLILFFLTLSANPKILTLEK